MRRVCCLLLAMLLLTGCAALPEEDRAFAVVLGLDREGETWRAWARIPSYQQEGGYLTLSAQGSSLGEAMAQLEAAAPMSLHYGQLRMMAFSRALAESTDFPGVLDALASRNGVRSQAALAVTEDDMASLMDALEPPTGTRLSKSLEAMMAARQEQGVIPDATLADLRRMGERQQPVLMRIALEDGMQLSGGWLFGADGRLQGSLTAAEQQLLSLMSGTFHQGTLSLREGTLTVTEADSRARLMDGEVVCSVRIRYTSSSFSEEGAAQRLSAALSALTAKLAAARCDALGLGRQAMTGCADLEAWHRLDWQTRYPALRWRFVLQPERET